ncbi:AMIN domain-containing protein [Herbivorax sp. ANBcel31]|uniref:N-acetylmuramoyl-L-alanine amidase n=1 Tax=Herbivorax sp. ANBcel31 TaxID=3069754 RepID=UPI0027B60E1D|nr:N-acetylmuramoyl-L-alanine amidase [Herbivorax sp. ANBcel31]MDQ2087827.1 AMIN domain-containing protein [Herbivorax sp. ANBcel31]
MTKKVLFVYLMSIILVLTPLGTFANSLTLTYDGEVHKYTGNIYSLKVNNELVDSDIPPIIINDRSLVPVRAIFESLGADVYWDGEEQKVLVSYRGMDVELTIDSYFASVNGSDREMEVPAKIINDRTMVPLRFVGEQLNMNVGFDGDKGEISIDSYDFSNLASLENVDYIKDDDQCSVVMSLDKSMDYRIQRVSDPERIIVDFPNTKIGSEKPSIRPEDSHLIELIRFGQFDVGTARVVLDIKDDSQYSVVENGRNIVLNVSLSESKHSVGKDNDGKELNILHASEPDYELVLIPIEDYKGYKDFILEDPDRIVIDIPHAIAADTLGTTDINSSFVNSIRCGMPEENVGRVVIDTNEQPYYKIIEDEGQLAVFISDMPVIDEPNVEILSATRGNHDREDEQLKNLLSVNYFEKDDYEEVELNVNQYRNYSITKDIKNNRIVVEIPDALAPVREQVIDVKSDLIEDISYISYNDKTARAFINLNGFSSYTVSEETGRLVLRIIEMDEEQLDSEEDTEIIEEEIEEQIEEEFLEEESMWEFDEDDDSYLRNQMSLIYERNQDFNKVMIGFSQGYEDYNISRLSNPDRIVVDVPNAYAAEEENTIRVNSNHINDIRYAQFEERIARAVIEVPTGAKYHVEELNTRLDIYVTGVDFKNVAYYGDMDRVHFILQNAMLTEGGRDLKKHYTGEYDLDGKRYTITFPSHLADLDTGTMFINDGIVDNIKIRKDASKNQTSIEFNTKEKYNYEIIYRSRVGNTAVNLLKPPSKEDRLVIIDPGHGGADPGAVHGGLTEEELNMDMAIRLNKLLKEQGVKTFMLREDNRYVGLYERAYIANTLDAALFLSIHNNAFHSRHKGTETLYFPPRSGDTSFNGKRFAEIVQHHVVNTLNTNDRGIIERPNLVVLRATAMPAALAEIAFMTNPEDLARLRTDEFRQQSAEALCKAILQALEELE